MQNRPQVQPGGRGSRGGRRHDSPPERRVRTAPPTDTRKKTKARLKLSAEVAEPQRGEGRREPPASLRADAEAQAVREAAALSPEPGPGGRHRHTLRPEGSRRHRRLPALPFRPAAHRFRRRGRRRVPPRLRRSRKRFPRTLATAKDEGDCDLEGVAVHVSSGVLDPGSNPEGSAEGRFTASGKS